VRRTAAPASAGDRGAAGPPERAATAAQRPSSRVITGLWAAVVLAATAAAAMTVVARGDLATGDLASNLLLTVAVVAYATLGAVIVRRAGNVIGWIMLGEGAGLAFLVLASMYAVIGVVTFPGSLPAAKQVGTLSECSFPAVVFTLAFMFLLFPTGTLPSRRWRPVAAAGLLLAALTTAGLVIHPRLVHLPAPGGVSLIFPNPLAVSSLGPVLRTVLVGTINGLTAVSVPFLAAALVSLAVRYRAGGRLLRQQIKWLVLTAVGFVVGLLIALLGLAAGQAWLATVAYTSVQIISLLAIPAAMAIAILRYRLYDIDVIISRAVVYGLLSAAFTAIYAGIVVGIGTFVGHQGGPVLTIVAAVTIALLFQPLRRRAQLFANRLVYGKRATPYQALSDFAGDMAGQLDLTEAVDRMVTVLAGATGADRAEAWIQVGAELRPAAIWPHGATPSAAVALGPDSGFPAFEGATRAVAVQHGGELLGALSLQKPRNEPLTSTEDELLQDLASQAGLVLRNAALIDELRASRRRLVEAQDAERRKIERNLHDGAQQQLIALTIQVGLLEESVGDPAAVRQLAPTVKDGLRAALEDLRDLARGIYPPLLADQGLVPALQAQARKASVPVEIDADGIGRYPQEAEAAVYFCALEALQNVAKYAGASRATVGLSCSDGSLRFTVTDDGAGFDTASTRHGTGLQGIADRLAALGGGLDVRSQPGRGTTLTGQLPVSAPGQTPQGFDCRVGRLNGCLR
jgi:signal transduction histidine kinase